MLVRAIKTDRNRKAGWATIVRSQPTHSSHHTHVATHPHHSAAHIHHITTHGHVHSAAHVAHSSHAASSATVIHTTPHISTHHAASIKAATAKIVHACHGATTEVIHGTGPTIIPHVATCRAGEVAILKAHIVVHVAAVVKVPSVIVKSVEGSSTASALVATEAPR